MGKYDKGDTFYVKQEDGTELKLYYIDEFITKDEDGIEDGLFLVCGGMGEDVMFVSEKDVRLEYETIDQKILNVLVDISQNMKYNSEMLRKISGTSSNEEVDDDGEHTKKNFRN